MTKVVGGGLGRGGVARPLRRGQGRWVVAKDVGARSRPLERGQGREG